MCCGMRLGKNKPIPLADSVTLHSWEKYQKYRVVPWKLVVDVTVIIFAVTSLVLATLQASSYSNAVSDSFENVFGMGGQGATRIYSLQQFSSQASSVVRSYYQLANISLSHFYHLRRRPDNSISPPRLLLRSFQSLGRYDSLAGQYVLPPGGFVVHSSSYDLVDDSGLFLGPLSMPDGQINASAVQNLVSATISFQLVSLNLGVLGSVPYVWTVNAVFDFVSTGAGGVALFKINSAKVIEASSIYSPSATEMALSSILFLLCVFSAFLSFRSLHRGWLNMSMIMKRVSHLRNPKFRNVPLRMKLAFFELWNIWNLIGVALLMASSIMMCLRSFAGIGAVNFDLALNLFSGVGTFFACVNILRHFRLSRRLNVLLGTLQISFNRIFWFLLSLLPVFLGLVFLAVSLFSQYTERFSGVDTSAVSLFALMTGDDVHATFDEMTAEYPFVWLSRIFLYCYCLFAITAVLNIFIFLIEDAFHAAKKVDRTSGVQGKDYSLRELIEEVQRNDRTLLYEWGSIQEVGEKGIMGGGARGEQDISPDDAEVLPLLSSEKIEMNSSATSHNDGLMADNDKEQLEELFTTLSQRMQNALQDELEQMRIDFFRKRPGRTAN